MIRTVGPKPLMVTGLTMAVLGMFYLTQVTQTSSYLTHVLPAELIMSLGMAGVFLSLRRVLPDRYPLTLDVERYIAQEQRLGRMLDYAVIVPRLQRLYEWTAEELADPRVLGLVRDGSPIYAWPFEKRHVWRVRQMPFAARVLERLTAG